MLKQSRSYLLLLFSLVGWITVHAQFNISEPFRTSVINDLIVLGGFDEKIGSKGALLTAAKEIDDPNEGWLRLTNDQNKQRGFAYINQSFPSALGVQVELEYKMYRTHSSRGADGFTIFLFDGEVGPEQFKIGGYGGSLGYKEGNGQGLNGGYVGIGFDVYGNFSDGTGNANRVVIRGPESLNYKQIAITEKTVPLAAGIVGSRPSDDDFYRKVQVRVEPIDENSSSIWVGWKTSSTQSDYTTLIETIINVKPFNTLKVGFAASTGDSVNFHEIRDMVATTPGNLRVASRSLQEEVVLRGDNSDGRNSFTFAMDVHNETRSDLGEIKLEHAFKDLEGLLEEGVFELTDMQVEGFLHHSLPTLEEISTASKFSGTVALGMEKTGTVTLTGRLLKPLRGNRLISEASVSTEQIVDVDLENNQSTASSLVTIEEGDLKVTKTAMFEELRSSSESSQSGRFEYEIMVENQSDLNLSKIQVADKFSNSDTLDLADGVLQITDITFDEGFTSVSGLPNLPTQNSGFNAEVGLIAGGKGVITVVGNLLHVPTGSELNNTVTVSTTEIEDLNPINNKSVVGVPVKTDGVDLTVTLDPDSACLQPTETGTTIEFFVVNNGTADANYKLNDLTVVIEYPEGVSFERTETDASEWSYDDNTQTNTLTVTRKGNKGTGYIDRNGGRGPGFPFYLASGQSYTFHASVYLTSKFDGSSAEPIENLGDNEVDLFIGVIPDAPDFSEVDSFVLFQGVDQTLQMPEGDNTLWWRLEGGEEEFSGEFRPSTEEAGVFTYEVYQKNHNCPGPSTTITVVVVPKPTPGIIGVEENEICNGSMPSTTIEEPAGVEVVDSTHDYQTNLSYRWEIFSDGAWVGMSNENQSELRATVISENTKFRRITISTLSGLGRSNTVLGDQKVLESEPTNVVEFTVKNCYIMVNPALPVRT